MNQNVIRSVFIVVLFWWIVAAAWGIIDSDADWVFDFETNGRLAISLACAGVAGITLIWLNVWTEKNVLRAQLGSNSIRGLTCTIGEVPLIALEPKQHPKLPPSNQVKEIPPGWMDQWLAKYDQSHPAHADLMRDLLRIYHYYAALPATHIEGGHGSRTLLDHSLLAGYYMDHLGATWRYSGLRDRTGKRVVLKLRDADFNFEPNDPLIAILGLAHDIGKIEAFIFDKAGKIIGIHHEHDLTGARMIARIPSSWKIPDEDRRALFLAIAHYHHPMELPLSPDRRAIDDRTIALMELLIKADFVVSRIESGGPEPSEVEYEQSSPQVETTPDRLLKAFLDIIGESSRINSLDKRFSVGTLCDGQGFSKPMLILNEASIRSAIVQRLQLPDQVPLGDSRYQITVDLLKAIDEKACLYKKHESHEFSAENALWNIDFYSRPEKGAAPVKKAGWSAAIIVDPKIHPRAEMTEPYWWYAIIERGTMGSGRAINKAGSVIRKHQNSANDLAADDDAVTAAMSKAGSNFSAFAQIDDDVEDDVEVTSAQKSAPVQAPASVVDNDIEEVGELAEDGEYYQTSDNPTRPVVVAKVPAKKAVAPQKIEAHQITPMLVLTALTKVVKASRTGEVDIAITEHNGLFVLTSRMLVHVLPQIEWLRVKYQIEIFCASGTLEAKLVPEKDGHYIIAIAREKLDLVTA